MAKQRNYAAEYQRRVQRERERAATENRPFSLRHARGHPENEAQINRIARLIKQSTGWGTIRDQDPEQSRENLRQAVRSARIQGMDDREIEQLLRDKKAAYQAYKGGDPNVGKSGWQQYTGRRSFLPVEFFFYHGQ